MIKNFLHALSSEDIAKQALEIYMEASDLLVWDIYPKGQELIDSILIEAKENKWTMAYVIDRKVYGLIILSDFIGYKDKVFSVEATIVFQNPRLARKAVKEMSKYLFEEVGVRKIYAKIGRYNPRAINFVEKQGFTLAGVIRDARVKKGKTYDEYVYVMENNKYGQE